MTTNNVFIRLAAGTGLVFITLFFGACGNGERADRDQASPASISPAADDAVAGEDEPRVTAVVLGQVIESDDPTVVQQAIFSRLFARYREEQGIEAAESEITALVDSLERGVMKDPHLTADDDLTTEEREQADALRRDMARSMILNWKTSRALYEQYGGRVIGQQFGPEPIDAYRTFLEEQQAGGAFSINDSDIHGAFWRYFFDDSMHDFLDPDAAAAAFATPPWERQVD